MTNSKNKNISCLLPPAAKKYPEKTAVTAFSHGNIVSASYPEIERLSSHYACEFRKSGIEKGTKTLMMLSPGIEFIAAVFAVFKCGGIPVFIDPGMGLANLLNCILKTNPEAMIGMSRAHWIRMFFPKTFRDVKIHFSLGTFSPPWLKRLRPPSPGTDISFEIVKCEADELAAIVFTTGSTGPPKGVEYTHGIYRAQLEIIRETYGAGPEETDMPGFPLFGLFSVVLGMPCVIPDFNPSRPAKADPERVARIINENRVTFSFGSPALWQRVCSYCLDRGIQMPTVKKALMAGCPVPPDLHKLVLSVIGDGGETMVPYGATEALPIASFNASELLEQTASEIVKGKGYCLGIPLPGMRIEVIELREGPVASWDESLKLPPGSTGEIAVKGPVVTAAYYRDPENTGKAKIRDGNSLWHRMGDMGYFDNDGRLWFRGRKSHVVECGDRTLYPVCCESIFNAHPSVYRSALVGVGPANNRTPVIIVEAKQGRAPGTGRKKEKFIRELREIAASNKQTCRIDKFLFHPAFPVDIRHNAKIFREKLASWAAEKMKSRFQNSA